MKIGILGGTFDPVHTGHLYLAARARDFFHLDQVLFIPAGIPPHKSDREGKTSALHRFQMTAQAIKGQKAFSVSDREIKREGLSFTYETLGELKEEYPSAELYLILGADAYEQLPGWKYPDKIMEMVTLLIAPRRNHDLKPSLKGRVWPIPMDEIHLTSSEIRQRLVSGMRLEKGSLPEGVEKYILENRLYRESKAL